jgi:2-polyprenyl-3-methyl-5-hydroxy-6-metoxy-1,4-benzoquinol methylase
MSANTMNSETDQSYYLKQSNCRGISKQEDVRRLAIQESQAYDLLIQPALGADRSRPIYEAATGPGILQLWLKERGYVNVEGSDFSSFEASLASEINPRIARDNSLVHLGLFSDNTFGVIIALDFLEHLSRPDFRSFLDLAFAKLAPGGILILRGPNGDSPFGGLNYYNDPTHEWCYTSTSLRVLHELTGFESIHFADESFSRLGSLAALKRPLRQAAAAITRCWVRLASGISLGCLGSSLYSYARKGSQSPVGKKTDSTNA